MTLKIETQATEDHQIKLKVELDPQPLEDAKRRAARKIAQRTKIPGFRPGKAPYPVIERFVGESAILEDALDLLVQDVYPKVVEEAGIKPYGPGTLENIISMEPPVFEFVIPLEAEVELGDYRSLRMPYNPQEVTEERVTAVLDDLRERQAVLEPVDRPALEGDQVQIRLSARHVSVEEGADDTLIKERTMPVVIEPERSETVEEWPYPGFSRQLIGLNSGEEKTLLYAFPDDSVYESLRGKEAEFHFVVEDVKSRLLPELDDEFAKSQGDYENLQDLSKKIRIQLEQDAMREFESGYEEKIVDSLVEDATIKFPPQMLENEADMVIHQLEDRLAQQRLDLDTYLKARQMDKEGLQQEVLPVAESRLKRSLVIYQVAEEENIQVGDEEVQAEALRTLDQLTRNLPPEEIRKLSTNELIPGMVSKVAADMVLHKTMGRLIAIAKGEADTEPESTAETGAEGLMPAEGADAGQTTEFEAEESGPVEEGTPSRTEESQEPFNPLEGESVGE